MSKEKQMSRLPCFLTGGHRYADKNLVSYQHSNPDFVTLHNECVKCGKQIEFEYCVGAYIRSEIAKRKGEIK